MSGDRTYYTYVHIISSSSPCLLYVCVVCMYGHTNSKSMDQPGKVASPARGQLNRKYEDFPVRVSA